METFIEEYNKNALALDKKSREDLEKIHKVIINDEYIETCEDCELLFLCAFYHHFVTKNYNIAIKLYEKTIKLYELSIESYTVHFSEESMANLYSIAMDSHNAKHTMHILEMLAKFNHDNAILELAYCHYAGWRTKKDIQKGIDILEKAANLGNTCAMKKLGQIYYRPEYHQQFGIKRNNTLAAIYYSKYADRIGALMSSFIILDWITLCWHEELHKIWPNRQFLKNQFITLLLISKNRKQAKLNWMVFGIAKIIIKHLGTLDKDLQNTYINEYINSNCYNNNIDTKIYDINNKLIHEGCYKEYIIFDNRIVICNEVETKIIYCGLRSNIWKL